MGSVIFLILFVVINAGIIYAASIDLTRNDSRRRNSGVRLVGTDNPLPPGALPLSPFWTDRTYPIGPSRTMHWLVMGTVAVISVITLATRPPPAVNHYCIAIPLTFEEFFALLGLFGSALCAFWEFVEWINYKDYRRRKIADPWEGRQFQLEADHPFLPDCQIDSPPKRYFGSRHRCRNESVWYAAVAIGLGSLQTLHFAILNYAPYPAGDRRWIVFFTLVLCPICSLLSMVAVLTCRRCFFINGSHDLRRNFRRSSRRVWPRSFPDEVDFSHLSHVEPGELPTDLI